MNQTAKKVEDVMESAGGKLLGKAVMVLLGVMAEALLLLILQSVQHGNSIAEDAQIRNGAQDLSINTLQQTQVYYGRRLDALDRKTDKQIQTLQTVATQVTHLTDTIKDKRSRPPR